MDLHVYIYLPIGLYGIVLNVLRTGQLYFYRITCVLPLILLLSQEESNTRSE
jgi:hypothetical protein